MTLALPRAVKRLVLCLAALLPCLLASTPRAAFAQTTTPPPPISAISVNGMTLNYTLTGNLPAGTVVSVIVYGPGYSTVAKVTYLEKRRAGTYSDTWNGKNTSGKPVADGPYTMNIFLNDNDTGDHYNPIGGVDVNVILKDGKLSLAPGWSPRGGQPATAAAPGTTRPLVHNLHASDNPFAPQVSSGSAGGTALAFDLEQDVPGFVIAVWNPQNTGHVRLLGDGPRKAGGSYEFFDGKDENGNVLPDGTYPWYVFVFDAAGNSTEFKADAPITIRAAAPVDQAARQQLILDAYQIALGRSPSDDEIAYWLGQPANDRRLASVDALVENHRQFLLSNDQERQDTIRRAIVAAYQKSPDQALTATWDDVSKRYGYVFRGMVRRMLLTDSYAIAFGRLPSYDETNYWLSVPVDDPRVQSLGAMLENNRSFMRADANERQNTIRRAVRVALGREANDRDIAAWDGVVGQPYGYEDVVRRLIVSRGFQLAFGREPAAAEWDNWLAVDAADPRVQSLDSVLSTNRAVLAFDQDERLATIQRAFQTAFGRDATDDDIAAWEADVQSGSTFQNVVRRLIVAASYQTAFGRDPNSGEWSYWLALPGDDPRLQSLSTLLDNHREWLANEITGYGPADIASLDPQRISFIGANRLNVAQVEALTTTQLSALVPQALAGWQIAALTPAQLIQLPASVIGSRIVDLRPAQVASLTPDQVTGLTADQIRAAGPASFTAAQVARLSPSTISAVGVERFQPLQLTQAPTSLIKSVGVSRFSPDQVAALNPATIIDIGAAQFSPAQMAAFARVQSGIVATGGGNIVATGAGNIVAAGGGNIVAAGGGNIGIIKDASGATIVSAGGGNIASTGSANLIGNDGASLISNDGGSLISNDGGSLISNDGGSIVSAGGGNLTGITSAQSALLATQLTGEQKSLIVASGGGNIVATGAGNIASTGSANAIVGMGAA